MVPGFAEWTAQQQARPVAGRVKGGGARRWRKQKREWMEAEPSSQVLELEGTLPPWPRHLQQANNGWPDRSPGPSWRPAFG